jgi:asparagine synthase (glutamine-hydrolysing)
MIPARNPQLPPSALHPATRQARVVGVVGFDARAAATAPGLVDLPDGRRQLIAPGLTLTIDPSVDCHADDKMVVLLQGQPQRDGRPVSARELAAVAARGPFDKLPVEGRHAAIVIDRASATVLLQTDRFGVWPLVWGRTGSALVFSDRADAVAAHTDAGIDRQALHNYVYFHMIPSPSTVFQGVSRVPPATAMRVTRDGTSAQTTWSPNFSRRRSAGLPELRAVFRTAITRAVESETAGGNVGCFLSGGTDSSTVAGTLKAVAGKAATFSIGFDASGYDEMAFARIAARHFGTDHHEHYVTPAELVAAIPRVAAHYDQPFGNSSAVPAFICATLAQSAGIRKLLAGDGGDELFGGNTRYARQKVFEAWWQVPEAARAIAGPAFANGLTRRLPILRKAASYVDQASVPMPGRMETYNLLQRFGREQVFSAAMLEGIDAGAPAALQAAVYREHADAPFVDRMLAYDWRFTLADNDLPKVSGTTRLAGLDVGYPLLADALVDVSTQLGSSDKVRGLRLRHFFKEALADFLPPEIIAKQKHGFGLPVGVWLVKDKAFRDLAHASLTALAGRQVIRQAFVDDLFSRRLEEHAGYYGEMVWVLMMLEQWLGAHRPRWTLT